MTGLVERVRAALLPDRATPLGAADCEEVSDGVLAQPIATASSVAFLGAAAWLALRLPGRGPERSGAARTGSAVCDPSSPLQAHAAWHVLMAAALAAWGGALWGTSRAGRR